MHASLSKFFSLFQGAPDRWAKGEPDPDKPWKYRYFKQEHPPTERLFERHLDGELLIGVYCEWLEESKCRWFAFDFDGPKDANDQALPDAFERTFKEALRCRDALLEAGLFTYAERSRSGSGTHLWGFLDEWVDCDSVVRALDAVRPQDLQYFDVAKRYPAKKRSRNGILLALPYAGEAVEQGNSMFVRDDGTEIPLDTWLAELQVNPAGVIRRIADRKPPASPAAPKAERSLPVLDASGVQVTMGASEGRPAKPITGLIKLLSPYGCQFMRGVMLNQHDPNLVGENEWYAFLGQLTAFENGRAAAHAIFREHRYYEPRGMDAKYDHAMENPPVGCAFIHERFPRLACQGCPMTAPYRTAMKSIAELVADDFEPLARATFDGDYERILAKDAGTVFTGIDVGFPGARGPLLARPGELTGFGAQPSIGKTAAMVHVANYVAKQDIDVAVFSAETGINSFHDRLIANESEVDSLALKGQRYYREQRQPLTEAERERVREAIERLRARPIYENYTTSSAERMLAAQEWMLCDRAKRGKAWTRPYLSLFDYFQYAQGTDLTSQEKEPERLAKRSYEFKALTKLTQQPWWVFAQLIRDSEGDNQPKITWWRGTGRFEHDIDVGLIMTGERMPGIYAPRCLHDVKDREGEVGWKHEMLLEQAVSRFKTQAVAQPSDELEPDAREDEFGQWTH